MPFSGVGSVLSNTSNGLTCDLVCEFCKTAPKWQDQCSRTTLQSRSISQNHNRCFLHHPLEQASLQTHVEVCAAFSPYLYPVRLRSSSDARFALRLFSASACPLYSFSAARISSGRSVMASKILSLLDRREKVQNRIYCISLCSYFTLRYAGLTHLLGRSSYYLPISTFMQDKGIVLLNCSITSALPCQISITLARGIFVLNDLVRSHSLYSSLTVLSRSAQASDYRGARRFLYGFWSNDDTKTIQLCHPM